MAPAAGAALCSLAVLACLSATAANEATHHARQQERFLRQPVRRQENILRQQQHPLRQQKNSLRQQQHPSRQQENLVRQQQHPSWLQEHPSRQQEHPSRQEENLVRQQQQASRLQEHPSRQQENLVRQQQHPSWQQEHPSRQQENLLRQQQHPSRLQEHPSRQQEHPSRQQENLLRQQQHPSRLQEHPSRQQEHPSRQEENLVRQQQQASRLQEHPSRQQENLLRQQQHPSRLQEHPSRQQEHPSRQQENLLRQQQHPSRLQEHPSRQQEHPSRQQENLLRQQQHPSRLQEHPSRQQEHPSRQEENLVRQQQQASRLQEHPSRQQENLLRQQQHPSRLQEHPSRQQEHPSRQEENLVRQQQQASLLQEQPSRQQENLLRQQQNPSRQQDHPSRQQKYLPQQDNRIHMQVHPIHQEEELRQQYSALHHQEEAVREKNNALHQQGVAFRQENYVHRHADRQHAHVLRQQEETLRQQAFALHHQEEAIRSQNDDIRQQRAGFRQNDTVRGFREGDTRGQHIGGQQGVNRDVRVRREVDQQRSSRSSVGDPRAAVSSAVTLIEAAIAPPSVNSTSSDEVVPFIEDDYSTTDTVISPFGATAPIFAAESPTDAFTPTEVVFVPPAQDVPESTRGVAIEEAAELPNSVDRTPNNGSGPISSVLIRKCCPPSKQLDPRVRECIPYDGAKPGLWDGTPEDLASSLFARSPDGVPWWLDPDIALLSSDGADPASQPLLDGHPPGTRVQYGVHPMCARFDRVYVPTFAHDRVAVLRDGRLRLALRTPWGAAHGHAPFVVVPPEEYCVDRVAAPPTPTRPNTFVAVACPCARALCVRKCCANSQVYAASDWQQQVSLACVARARGEAAWAPAPAAVGAAPFLLLGDAGLACREGERPVLLRAAPAPDAPVPDYRLLPNGSALVDAYLRAGPIQRVCAERVRFGDDLVDNLHLCIAPPSVTSADPLPVARAVYGSLTALGAFFLLLALCVYVLLPDLRRSAHAKALLCHTAALLAASVALASGQLRSRLPQGQCYAVAFIVQFSFLAAFFWLNVMCVDIAWAFSGWRAMQGSILERDRRKFLLYSLYAWGCPAIITAVTALLQFADGLPEGVLRPDIGRDTCWFYGTLPTLAFFYGPMAALLATNALLFAYTTVRIVRVQRETAVLSAGADSGRHDSSGAGGGGGGGGALRGDRKRFMLYLKLFCLMGVTWVTEIISWAEGSDGVFWYITDAINLLRGLFIFLLFCCKPKVLKLLRRRLNDICPCFIPCVCCVTTSGAGDRTSGGGTRSNLWSLVRGSTKGGTHATSTSAVSASTLNSALPLAALAHDAASIGSALGDRRQSRISAAANGGEAKRYYSGEGNGYQS